MSAIDTVAYALAEAGKSETSPLRLATVTDITGGVSVQFDGESVPSTRKYKRLSSYTAVFGNRVLMAQSGTTWVILGTLAD